MWNNSRDRNVLVYEGLDIDVLYVLLGPILTFYLLLLLLFFVYSPILFLALGPTPLCRIVRTPSIAISSCGPIHRDKCRHYAIISFQMPATDSAFWMSSRPFSSQTFHNDKGVTQLLVSGSPPFYSVFQESQNQLGIPSASACH